MTFNLSKVILAGACALGLATLPLALPASAQTGAPDTTQPTGSTSSQATDTTRDDDFNWGWLGLLGLAGLAGLTRKPEQPQAYREPNEVSRSSSRP